MTHIAHIAPIPAPAWRAPAAAAAVALALLLPTLAAHAQHSTQVIVGSQSFTSIRFPASTIPPPGSGQQQSPRSSAIHPSEASVASSWSQGVGGWQALGSGSASGRASFGALAGSALAYGSVVGAAGSAPQSNGSGAGNGDAEVTANDTLLFTIPGLSVGTPVTISWAVSASGSISGAGQRMEVSGSWRTDLGSSGVGSLGFIYQDDTGALTGSQALAQGRFEASSTVLLGTPVDLRMRVSASVVAQSAGRCSDFGCANLIEVMTTGFADLGSTLTWGGLVSVSDANGNALNLSALNVASSSGFDYRNAYAAPVPEPGTLASMLTGLAGMATVLRRRRAERA